MPHFPAIIGRSEQLDFVDLGVVVPAKIDTGAYRSAIHCVSAKEHKHDGGNILRAELLGHPSSPKTYTLEFARYELVSVKNSFGDEAIRYKIRLRVKLGSKVFWSSFTLADRSNNLMPVLVGRELLNERFLVDVSKTSVDRLKLKEIFIKSTKDDYESEY
jgi:hypothetical protein